MRRVTIVISDEIEAGLDAYIRQEKASPSLAAVMQAALQEFLLRRGFIPDARELRITPAKRGSGARDVSLDHDHYLAKSFPSD